MWRDLAAMDAAEVYLVPAARTHGKRGRHPHPTSGGPSPLFKFYPMRILHLLFSSRLAGSERYCADLANRQVAEGHEVHVVGATGSPLAVALAPGIRFHGFNRLLRGLRVRRLLDAIAPDICHGHLSAACKILGRASSRHQTVATLHVGYKPH